MKTSIRFVNVSVLRRSITRWGVCALLLLFASCCQLAGAKEELDADDHAVHNIYGVVDMSLFHGFDSKMTVKDIQAKHGKPSRILDASEVAGIAGYDIWEYDIQQDKIDCFVMKNDNVVDYVFCRFAEPHRLHDIVKDKQVIDNITADKTICNFLTDDFMNSIVFFMQDDSTDYVVNMTIDGYETLPDSESLHSKLEKISKELPIPLPYLVCNMSSCSYKDKTLTIICDVNDTPSCDVVAKMKSDPDFGRQWAVLFLGDKGIFSDLTAKILEEKADIDLVFKGNVSKATASFKVKAGTLLGSPTSAMQRLKAMMAYENIGLVNLCNDKHGVLKMAPRVIKNNVLCISMTYAMEPNKMNDAEFKNYITKSFLDGENPDQEMLMTCAQSGAGLRYMSTFAKDGKQETYTASFTNDELKDLRAKIK